MSRIGKQPVHIASGVEVKVADGRVRVKGPKGSLEIGRASCRERVFRTV